MNRKDVLPRFELRPWVSPDGEPRSRRGLEQIEAQIQGVWMRAMGRVFFQSEPERGLATLELIPGYPTTFDVYFGFYYPNNGGHVLFMNIPEDQPTPYSREVSLGSPLIAFGLVLTRNDDYPSLKLKVQERFDFSPYSSIRLLGSGDFCGIADTYDPSVSSGSLPCDAAYSEYGVYLDETPVMHVLVLPSGSNAGRVRCTPLPEARSHWNTILVTKSYT